MNIRAKGRARKPNTRKMIILGVMVLAAVYHFSRPTLEKWFNTSLPNLNQNDNRQAGNDYNYDANLPSSKLDANAGQSARDWMQDIGGGKFKSPAGLIYTRSKREHRIDHVLMHCKDDQSKPTHGIFVGSAVEVMKMVDEAYEMTKSGSGNVDTDKESGDKVTHTVSMGRVVGHTGGKKAQRQGRKELKRIKLVLGGGNRVITAFPK